MAKASRDQIIMSIHVLWERGWQVNPVAVQEMLTIGSHVQEVSLDRIARVIEDVDTIEAKEQWLSFFNPHSEFNVQHPRPWPIESVWCHQHIEE